MGASIYILPPLTKISTQRLEGAKKQRTQKQFNLQCFTFEVRMMPIQFVTDNLFLTNSQKFGA